MNRSSPGILDRGEGLCKTTKIDKLQENGRKMVGVGAQDPGFEK